MTPVYNESSEDMFHLCAIICIRFQAFLGLEANCLKNKHKINLYQTRKFAAIRDQERIAYRWN